MTSDPGCLADGSSPVGSHGVHWLKHVKTDSVLVGTGATGWRCAEQSPETAGGRCGLSAGHPVH